MDKLRDMAATGVRIGSGWGASIPAMEPGLGSLAGAGIAGLGEGAAELIEGSPLSPARMGTEAVLGAVPLGKIFKAGRAAQSAIRSGALSGAGTLMRQQARGEDVNLKDAGNAALIGAMTGGVLGHLTGGAASKAPAPEFDVIEQAGGKTTYVPRTPAQPAPPVDPRTAYFAKQGLNPPTGPGRMASAQGQLPFDIAEPSGVPTPYGIPAAPSNRPSAKASIKAEADAVRAKAIEDDILAGNLTQGAPKISESLSASLPGGGTIRRNIPYKPPVEDQIDDLLGGGGKSVAGKRTLEDVESAPPPEPPHTAPSSGEEAFQAWRARVGLPDTPSTRRDFPWGLVGGETAIERPPTSPLTELLTPKPVEGVPGVRAITTHTPETASPNLLDWQGEPPYSTGGGLSIERVASRPFRGAPEAPQAPIPGEVVSYPAQALTEAPEASQGPQSAIARFFKTRVDAAGQANRDIKAANIAGEQVPEAGRAAAGAALRREAKAAGLPTGKQVPPVSPETPLGSPKDLDAWVATQTPPVEPTVPGAGGTATEEPPIPPSVAPGVSQTSKARESALAKRTAAREANKPLEGQALADLFRKQGREDLAQQIEGQASKLGGEKGAVDVATLAMLLRAGVGAGVGGAVGAAGGHPLLGAVGGAAAGAFGPAALSAAAGHLRAAGVPSDVIARLPDDVETAGVKETAKKIWHTLPQLQRFNYLMDLEGLPANAVVGPYGSAVMAALEHGLSGDPRGWAALNLLTPQRFAQEFKGSFNEAGRLIAEGELGRAETSASLFKNTINVPGLGEAVHPLQAPGQVMTAGDVAARNILHEAGFSEAEARRITLTSEPEAALPKAIANMGRGKRDWSTPIGELMLPFKRTPANVWEQGLQRAPLVGFGVQSFREAPDPFKQQIVQQLMSTGVGVGSGVLGASVDPETAKWMRRYVSNAGGQYSLPATVGFAAGQAIRGGKPAITEGVKAGINQLPLPTTQPISDIAAFLSGEKRAPRGIAPPAVRDWLFPPAPTGSTTGGLDPLPGVPSLRSLRGR